MGKLQELQNKLAAADAAIDALLQNDDLSPEQEAEYGRLKADREKLVGAIGREKDRLAREEEREKLAQEADKARRVLPAGPGRLTDAATPALVLPAQARDREDPRRGFRTHTEYLTAVMNAGRGLGFDNRLKPLATVGSDEARGISDPAGGFLIPAGFSPDLLKVMPEADPLASLTRKVPMASPIVKIPARADKNHSTSVSGGLTVTRRPETVAGTASQMTLEMVSLEAHSLFGLSYATEELLARSAISFVTLLETGFAEQFAWHLVNERLNGTGVGEFQGVLNAACLVSVSKETGQAAATITKENIDKMRARCWGYGRAVWLANHDTLPQLRSLVQSVGTGGAPVSYVSVDANGNATLDGRPLMFTEHCATLGTVGDLVLGNWSEYLEGTYRPMDMAESIHVRFVNHERAFKFWVENAGSPWWKSALTPKNGSNTLSPFVALATRS